MCTPPFALLKSDLLHKGIQIDAPLLRESLRRGAELVFVAGEELHCLLRLRRALHARLKELHGTHALPACGGDLLQRVTRLPVLLPACAV